MSWGDILLYVSSDKIKLENKHLVIKERVFMSAAALLIYSCLRKLSEIWPSGLFCFTENETDSLDIW
jgi:hypothetical protein